MSTNSKKGRIVFYGILALLVVASFVGLEFYLRNLDSKIENVAENGSDLKAKEVVSTYFSKSAFDRLLSSAGIELSPYESRDVLISEYAERLDEPLKLRKVNTAQGRSSYEVDSEDDCLGTFDIVGYVTEGYSLENVVLPLNFDKKVNILIPAGVTVLANGQMVAEEYITERKVLIPEGKTPGGDVLPGEEEVTFTLAGLHSMPNITALSAEGDTLALDFNGADTYVAKINHNDEETDAIYGESVKKALESITVYMTGVLESNYPARYLLAASELHQNPAKMRDQSRELIYLDKVSLENVSVDSYRFYDENTFSVHTSSVLRYTVKNSDKEESVLYDLTLFFSKDADGEYRVYDIVAMNG